MGDVCAPADAHSSWELGKPLRPWATCLMLGRNKRTVNDGPQQLGAIAYMPGGIFDLLLASVFINILALAMPLTLL